MWFKKIISTIAGFLSKPTTEKKSTEKKKKRDRRRVILTQLWQQFSRFIQFIKKRYIDTEEEKLKKSQAKKKLKKKEEKDREKEEEETKEKAKQEIEQAPSSIENDISYIGTLLNKYEEYIKNDFFLLIDEANFVLRSWKANIMNSLSVQNAISISEISKLSTDLHDITDLYTQSEVVLEDLIEHCRDYEQIIKDTRRQINPQQKFNQIQCKLEKVRKQLEKGQKMTSLNQNKDYSYLQAYVERNQSHVISR